MYIEKVIIKNIRSIRYLEMDFPNPKGWHVLIGDNGSGKTSILRAIALALMDAQNAQKLHINFKDYINFKFDEGLIKIIINQDPNTKFFFPQDGDFRESNNLKFQLGVKLTKEKEGEYIIGKIENLDKDYKYSNNIDFFEFAAAFGPFRRFEGGKDWERIYTSNPKVAPYISIFGEDVALTEGIKWMIELNYKSLEGDNTAKFTLECLKKFINNSNLLPQNSQITNISSAGVFIEDGNSNKISVYDMSDGFRSILSMTFEIIRLLIARFGSGIFKYIAQGDKFINNYGIILIDEIDAHLHPTWQTRIGHWFTEYFPNMQFIVTTHSPLICRACEKGSIWRLATPGKNMPQIEEIIGVEKERLIYGNILDAYGTELFGREAVRSNESNEKKERLGKLNILYALGKITEKEEQERRELQKILTTDDPTGFE